MSDDAYNALVGSTLKRELRTANGNTLKRELRTGFTLMELMVAVAILVMIILAVGMTFSGVSRSIGIAQATMDNMAGVRETQRLIDRDLQGLDRNGFLVIRCRLNDPSPAVANVTWRFDQISFLEQGQFPNRSGANTASPFTDSSVASAAHVWIGQGVLESASPPDGSYLNTNPASASPATQGTLPGGAATWRSVLPTGVTVTPMLAGPWENRCTLMMHRTLLFPGPASGGIIQPAGNQLVAYAGIDMNETVAATTNVEGVAANITSSRYSTAALTAPQVMQQIAGRIFSEYDFTYRFRALDSVYDTEVITNPFVNGYFRTTPIVMRGVSSFRIEWTDGRVDANQQLQWWGPLNPYETAYPGVLPANTELISMPNANSNGDNYVAVFSYYNRAFWPKALKISMHVANDRIGGRDFVQVVNLPQ